MKLLDKFPKLSAFRAQPRKTLRAATAKRSLRAATASYEEMAEPNMKLSRALLIVLLLHVVAVSGIIAFNAIKTKQNLPPPMRAKTSAPPASAKTDSWASSSSPNEIAPSKPQEIRKARPAAKENTSARREEARKSYKVEKGDNPASIARKFKVSYDELLAINHIDDPRKLKIGQKILIPNKGGKGKKAEE
jgi:LysM repeat protein